MKPFHDDPSLSPLTWSADIRFGFDRPMQSNQSKPQSYEELLQFLEEVQLTLGAVNSRQPAEDTKVEKAAKFFDQLGQLLGTKADNVLRAPSGGTRLLQERFSFQ